jgi:hypothetical protein
MRALFVALAIAGVLFVAARANAQSNCQTRCQYVLGQYVCNTYCY